MYKSIVKCFQKNGRPYPICDRDRLQVDIRRGRRHVPYELTIGGTEPDSANLVTVNFPAKKSGDYVFEVLLNEIHINGSPFSQDFLPGD